MASPPLVLASGSPRRRELLAGLDLTFDVRPVDIDESPHNGEAPVDYVLRLAREKAAAGAATAKPDELVLAADTIVALDGDLLGKPRDPADARAMLRRLSAQTHEVLTGVALDGAPLGNLESHVRTAAVERTRVTFAALTDEEIAWYVDTEEPLDKAGAYGIQRYGALFVERVEGNYSNVVGLPIPLTYRLLRDAGFGIVGELVP